MSSRGTKATVTPSRTKASTSSSEDSSGSSSQRKSSRLSSKSLLKQVAMTNFLKSQITESPRTLFRGLSQNQNSSPLVKNDATMTLTPVLLTESPSTQVSKRKRKSFHEDSFLHPSQKEVVLSPVAKKKSSASSVTSSISTSEVVRGDAAKRHWKRLAPVGRFGTKRQTKESIQAVMFGDKVPTVAETTSVVEEAKVSVSIEEEHELEFTALSIGSGDLHCVEVAGAPMDSFAVADKTKVYKNVPDDGADSGGNAGTKAGKETNDPEERSEVTEADEPVRSRKTNRISETAPRSVSSGKSLSRNRSPTSSFMSSEEKSRSFQAKSLRQSKSKDLDDSSEGKSKRSSLQFFGRRASQNFPRTDSVEQSHQLSASEERSYQSQSTPSKQAALSSTRSPKTALSSNRSPKTSSRLQAKKKDRLSQTGSQMPASGSKSPTRMLSHVASSSNRSPKTALSSNRSPKTASSSNRSPKTASASTRSPKTASASNRSPKTSSRLQAKKKDQLSQTGSRTPASVSKTPRRSASRTSNNLSPRRSAASENHARSSDISQAALETTEMTEPSSRRRLNLSSRKLSATPKQSKKRSGSLELPLSQRLSFGSDEEVPETEDAVENDELSLLSLSHPEVEKSEETSRGSYSGCSTPHLQFTPKLPHKNPTPKSEWRGRAKVIPENQISDKPSASTKPAKSQNSKLARKKPASLSIPRKLTHNLFQFFAESKVSKEALAEVEQIAEEFWDNIVDDLEVYAHHAGRNTIERSDVELSMRRQRFVTDKISLNSLIEKHMALEDREALIPVARSGNRLE